MFKRLRTLWELSKIDMKSELPLHKHNGKNETKDISWIFEKNKMATIVDAEDKIDLFPNEEENGNSN